MYILFTFTLDAQNGMTPLMAAAQNNHLEAVEVLLTEYNSNINARDRVRQAWLSHFLQNTVYNTVCLKIFTTKTFYELLRKWGGRKFCEYN